MNSTIMTYINKLEGYRIRTRECHWDAPNMSLHKLCDDIMSDLEDYEDEIAEDAQGLYGQIKIGMLVPILPEATDLQSMLVALRKDTAFLLKVLKEIKFTGIVNILEEMVHKINQWIYLERIAAKG